MVIKGVSALCLLVLLSSLAGCGGSIAAQVIANSYPTAPRNYKTAGFDNSDQIRDYALNYKYLAFKISNEDWDAFYKRFPEYWSDIQDAKGNAFMNDYNVGYTAYAFRWNMMRYKEKWDEPTIKRLKSNQIVRGDDLYKTIYALGSPERIIWDNDFDILIYKNDVAVLIDNDKYKEKMDCNKCTIKMNYEEKRRNSLDPNADIYVMNDDQVLTLLKQIRPEY